MKKTRKLLSFVLALLMLTSLVPITMTSTVSALPTGTGVIFVKDGGTGNGSNPVNAAGSLVSAIKSVADAGGGTVVICGPVTINGNMGVGVSNPNITIKVTSLHEGTDYRETADAALVFGGNWKNLAMSNNFEYDDINILMKGNNCSFYADGYRLYFGKNVKIILDETLADEEANYPNIYGGSAFDLSATKNFPSNTSVTVLGGTWRRILGRGYGVEAKPRPSVDVAVSIGSDVKVLDKTVEGGFQTNEYSAFSGKRTVIYNGGKNESAADVPADVEYVITASGNGYVEGVSSGVVNLWAGIGYGAKIGDTVYPNGEFKFEGNTLTVEFVESDVNKEAELDALRPKMPAAFPGVYIKGYDNGDGTFSFRPSGNITIAEAATILVRLVTSEEEIKGKYTTDKANAGDWFYDNVAYLDSFFFFDTFDGFDGNRAITRAEFVKLISLASNLKETGDEIKFTDVPETHKYYNDIKLAAMVKLVNGYENGDGTYCFKPDASITRAEVVTVINRVFDIADVVAISYKNYLPDFTDVDETHWAAYQIIAAAGGKEKPKEEQSLAGTGEVEHTVEGKVIFANDNTGSKENDGLTPETAVPYKTARNLVQSTGGTIVLCAPTVFTSNTDLTLDSTKTTLITSVYNGVDYRVLYDAAFIFDGNWKNLVPAGPVIIDNVAFISKGSNNSIYCDNQNVVFGKDVVCVVEEGAAPINIYAGSAQDLSSCKNYVGSESTSVRNMGVYVANVTVGSGKWGIISGGNNGSTKDAPTRYRNSNGSVLTVGEGVEFSSITGGTKEEDDAVLGLRVVILNNTLATLSEGTYDAIVNVKGDAEASVVSAAKDKVVVKVTTADGRQITGLSADGTFEITGTGVHTIIVNDTEATCKTTAGGGMFIDDNVETVSDEYMAELDKKTEARKAEILAAASDIKPKEGKTAYYVSFSGGDDANDGKSPETAWKTIEKANSVAYAAGDVVYFKRGDEWRGVTLQAKSGVSYSAYGEGDKPVINRSPFDGAKHGSWTLVPGYTNIYQYSETFNVDIGYVAFNNRTFDGVYSQKVLFNYDGGNNLVDRDTGAAVESPLNYLKGDLYFWHDMKGPNRDGVDGTLYLRSDSGNPAERFTNIEFHPRANGIAVQGANVTIDNIAVRHAGVHGVGSSQGNNLLVQNCVFEYIGGSIQSYSSGKAVRLGNAVEVYGDCDGYTVDNCYFEQVYDAGVTHQHTGEDGATHVMKNVTYSNNIMIKCHYSIEHFNRAKEGTNSYLANILYKDNICRLAGYGFGTATRPDTGSSCHIRSGAIVDTTNFVIEGNIFDRSFDGLFRFASGGDEEIRFKNNTYIQPNGGLYGLIKSTTRYYTPAIVNDIKDNFKHPEVGGNYLFVKGE